MALLGSPTARTVTQIVLAVVIAVLGFVLIETILGPQREFQREQAITQESRHRMHMLRRALMAHEREFTGYPRSLDSLEYLIRNDSFFVANRDSIFQLRPQQQLQVDSLFYSARGARFEYVAVHNDTLNVWIYLLRNPVTGDSIGTTDATRAVGLRHAASWE